MACVWLVVQDMRFQSTIKHEHGKHYYTCRNHREKLERSEMVAVEVLKSELVFPSEETPKHCLWLSNLDIIHAWKKHIRMVYIYRPNSDPRFFNVEALKAGLSKALVPFYPIAGRLGKDRDGRLEIDCRGPQGSVLLVVARSESSIDEFGELFFPSQEMSRMLTPAIPPEDPDILFMAQVTFLEGGGAILGTSWNHIAGDAVSAMGFLNTWSRMTRGITNLDVHPLHDRTLLRARSPPKVLFDHIGNRLPCAAASPTSSLSWAFSILPLTKSQLALLTVDGKISTFCAVSAHVWKCLCVARGLARDQTVRLNFPVNARRRMNPPLPESYFGNVVVAMVAVATVDYVVSNPVEVVAHKIRAEIQKVDDEYVRSRIDNLEVNARNAALESTLMSTKADLKIVSWHGMPLYGADFGWGKPDIARRIDTLNGRCLAIILPGSKEDEVLVPIILEKENTEAFRKVFFDGLINTNCIK